MLQAWDFGAKFIGHNSRQIWQPGRAGQEGVVALSSQSLGLILPVQAAHFYFAILCDIHHHHHHHHHHHLRDLVLSLLSFMEEPLPG